MSEPAEMEELEELPSISSIRDEESEEELPSISSIRNEESDEELPSVPSNDPPQDEQEELLSLSNSPVIANQNEGMPSMASSSGSVEDAEPSNPSKIRGFRTRVDENGEEVFEFASDSGSEEESPHNNVNNPAEEASTSEVNFSTFLTTSPTLATIPRRRRTTMPRTMLSIQDSSSDESDEDYIPSSRGLMSTEVSGIGQRVASRSGDISGYILGRSATPGPSRPQIRRTAASEGNTTTSTTTKRRRKRKQSTPKKKKSTKVTKPKIEKPTKPLAPKVIYKDVEGNANAKLYKAERGLAASRFRVAVNFEEHDSTSYHKIGEIYLKIMEDDVEVQIEDVEQLLVKFPGLKEMNILSSEFRNFALLEFKREKTLLPDVAKLMPTPTLKKEDKNRPLVYIVRTRSVLACDIEGLPNKLFSSKGLGNKKYFRCEFVGFNPNEKQHQVNILLDSKSILMTHELSQIPYEQAQNDSLKEIFQTMFGIALPLPEPVTQTEEHAKEDIPWFYGQIKKYHDSEILPQPDFSLQPKKLGANLRPYQKNAVHWMLYREGAISSSKSPTHADLVGSFLSKMYLPVTINEKPAFYNPFVGYPCWHLPAISSSLPSGGILADEMGLGKTVEVMSLILLNPRPENEYHATNTCTAADFSESEENMDGIEGQNDQSDESSEFDSSNVTTTDDSNQSWRGKKQNKRTVPKIIQQEPRKSRRSSARTISYVEDATTIGLLHPNLRRRRNVSPSTFKTGSAENEAASIEDKQHVASNSHNKKEEYKSQSKRKLVQQDAADDSEIPSKSPKKSEQQLSTYQRVKVLYDAELRNYSETNRNTVKFNGTFFDTNIVKRACFECVCGEEQEDYRKVIRCASCHSSQHAACVGFTKEIERRFSDYNLEYRCPHCTSMADPYPTKSTLIITPSSISHQWISELKHHVNKQIMNILFYKGVSYHGYLPPAKIAEYDIVITTYNVLASELNFVDLPHLNSENGRKFRNPKRFMTIPSPLTSVSWWRVCLDEAQMVEGIQTKMSTMALRLNASHRWCVTGTPVNEGILDLFGLFCFVGLEPICLDFWWKKLVEEPFQRKDLSLLYELFGQLIWRTGKMDVLDQLGIPPQTSLDKWLSFSALEAHFYKQQYSICSKKILEKISRLFQSSPNILRMRLSALDRQTLQTILVPFLELRQACCHPAMVKNHSISLQKGTLTMEELLTQLIKKASLQCSEDHRQIVAALNGMAGIHIIKEEWLSASELYREVLRSAEQTKDLFTTDSLQLLHTTENLADLLDKHHGGIPYTLRDASLRENAEELKKKYLDKYQHAIQQAKEAVDPLVQLTDELAEQFKNIGVSWWANTLSAAARYGKIDDLIRRIKEELTSTNLKKTNNPKTLATKFDSGLGLENVLVEELTKIESSRKKTLEGLGELQKVDPVSFVDAAVSCHLRKKSALYYKGKDEQGFRCQLCQHHDRLIEYEDSLFQVEKKEQIVRTGRKWQQHKIMGNVKSDLTEEERTLVLLKEEEDLIQSLEHVNAGLSNELKRGTWGDSDTEKIIKLINNFARVNKLREDIRKDGSLHLRLFEAMKKEFRLLRILWRQVFDQISAHDEIWQATTRLCLKFDNGGSTVQEEEPGTSTSATGSSRRKSKKPNKKIKELESGYAEQDQKLQNINILEPHEVEIRFIQMQSELEEGKENLGVHQRELIYIKSLGNMNKGQREGEDCPICQNPMGLSWAVLKCCHSYCTDCVKQMCPNVLHGFLCALCRRQMKYNDITFVDNREPEQGSPSKQPIQKKKIEIKGSHSTKVEAIIEACLELQDTHPGEKIIIFSTWINVIEIISKALTANDISNCLLNQPGSKKFHDELEKFKTYENIQVLLMPLSSGSKGLNIIEATHILLVEPILSSASELQAIGRIHRIGQTKPTFVHRFYVKHTIEEQLFNVLKKQDVSSDEGELTVADLQNLIHDGQKFTSDDDIDDVITLEEQ